MSAMVAPPIVIEIAFAGLLPGTVHTTVPTPPDSLSDTRYRGKVL